jgi:hypothetical protein
MLMESKQQPQTVCTETCLAGAFMSAMGQKQTFALQ